MFVVLPIRTESDIKRLPLVNYGLIGLNVFCFMIFNVLKAAPLIDFQSRVLALHSAEPAFYEFFTYQFVHADAMHLLGNLLFLWVFGNSVNSKMGDLPYLLFYLAGGVFAGWGFAALTPGQTYLIGASGSIAAVTTAFLVLFPRSKVTVLLWIFIFIRFVQVPAMLMIGLKIIVWDNIIAPGLSHGQDSIANSAHLAGYLFGFAGALGMLLLRALPRDQFDILALWKRWNKRREFAAVMSKPGAAEQAQFGSVARVATVDSKKQAEEEKRLDELGAARTLVTDQLARSDLEAATSAYEELIALDEKQCLSAKHQLEIARAYYADGQSPQAAAAFERFVESYPNSTEAGDLRLLLGIIYARDLQQYEDADRHLSFSLNLLRDPGRLDQCKQWLHRVRDALGKPASEL